MNNVIFRAALAKLLQWKSNNYYTFRVFDYSLSYPACNTHGQYYHLCPDPLYNISPRYLIKGTIF
jgi:hypothetical protein